MITIECGSGSRSGWVNRALDDLRASRPGSCSTYRRELPEQLLREYIGKNMLTESSFYREIFEEGETKGEARGEARAKAQGLIRVFVGRFNHLDDALTRRIRAETRPEVLDAWFNDALILADEPAMFRLAERIKGTPAPQV